MADTVEADAPGRVNLIGEHTDYHEGFVLPTVIPQRTHVRLTPRADRLVRAWSATIDSSWQEYELGGETPGRGWLDYVQGVTAVLARRGNPVGGFDARIDSKVPLGAGLSSSAALTVSLLRAVRLLWTLKLSDIDLAVTARAVETDFVGAPVGVMDQLASSLGHEGEALFIDTRSLATTALPIPRSVELVVIDSGVPHEHARGAYGARRNESFEAASRLGVAFLRDLGMDAMPRVTALPPMLARRARHVISENQRVVTAADALRAGDVTRLGALFAESHASMRDDYEISTPEVDLLVTLGQQHPDVLGARMTGGGFGGAVVMIARAGAAHATARHVHAEYAARTGCAGRVLIP